MRHRRDDPDRPRYERARKWASELAGVRLVLAKEHTEPGARWVRYYPGPFVVDLEPGPTPKQDGCSALLRPTRSARNKP